MVVSGNSPRPFHAGRTVRGVPEAPSRTVVNGDRRVRYARSVCEQAAAFNRPRPCSAGRWSVCRLEGREASEWWSAVTLLPDLPPVTASHEWAWRHFERRLWERHGLTIGLIEYTRLCLEIAAQDLTISPIVLNRRGRTTLLLRVRVQGQTVPCLWRTDPGLLVTAYLPTMTLRSPGEVRRVEREKAQRLRRRVNRYRRHPKHRKESL